MTDDGRELVVGDVYALRGWRLNKKRGLHSPIFDMGDNWVDGENTSKCPVKSLVLYNTLFTGTISLIHGEYSRKLRDALRNTGGSVDEIRDAIANLEENHFSTCSCGFYGTYTQHAAKAQGPTVGVIKCTGQVDVGPRGLRTEKAVPVAIALNSTSNVYPDLSKLEKRVVNLCTRIAQLLMITMIVVAAAWPGNALHRAMHVAIIVFITAFYQLAMFGPDRHLGVLGPLTMGRQRRIIKKMYPSCTIYPNVDTMVKDYSLGLGLTEEYSASAKS